MTKIKTNQSSKKRAIELFCKYTKVSHKDILKIRRQDEGYSNDSFKISTKSNDYIVRIGKPNSKINRVTEANILKEIALKQGWKIYYHNPKNGDDVRIWINGTNPTSSQLKSLSFYKLLAKNIDEFRNFKFDNVDKKNNYMNYYLYDDFWSKIDNKYHQEYNQILKNYQNQPLSFSHNDLTPWNVVYDKKSQKIYFIDFEWSSYNWPIFDIANFIRDAYIHNTKFETAFLIFLDQKYHYNDVLKFIFISCCYSFLWSFSVQSTKEIIKYQAKVKKMLMAYYDEIQIIKNIENQIKILWEKVNNHLDWKKYLNDNKISYRKFNLGYTNESYLIEFGINNKYVLRIANNSVVSRKNESLFFKKTNNLFSKQIIFYDYQNGNSLSHYIEGKTLSKSDCLNFKVIDKVIDEIQKIHKLDLQTKLIDKINWFQYNKFNKALSKEELKLFAKLTNEFNTNLCISHGDCTPWNIIYNKLSNNVKLLDWEWVRLNHPCFDFANFIREANLHNTKIEDYICKKINISKTTMTKMLYISSVFAYLYMCSIGFYPSMQSYCKKQILLIKKLYLEIIE